MIVTKSLIIKKIGPCIIAKMKQSLNPNIPGLVGCSMKLLRLNRDAAFRLKALLSSYAKDPYRPINDEELFSCNCDDFELFTDIVKSSLEYKDKNSGIKKLTKAEIKTAVPKVTHHEVKLHTKNPRDIDQGKYVDKLKSSNPKALTASKGNSAQIAITRSSNTNQTNKKLLNDSVKLRGDIDFNNIKSKSPSTT